MSQRRRGSKKQGKGKAQASGQGRGKGNNGGGRNSRRNKGGGAKNAKKFWGDPTSLPEPVDGVLVAEDATAVVNSIGRPPIHGQENVATHYFRAVYGGSAQLAGALAAAGGLLADPADEIAPPPEPQP